MFQKKLKIILKDKEIYMKRERGIYMSNNSLSGLDQSYSYSEDEIMLQIFGNDYNKMKMTDKDIMDVVFNKKTEKMYNYQKELNG
jgi:hypothetical protein